MKATNIVKAAGDEMIKSEVGMSKPPKAISAEESVMKSNSYVKRKKELSSFMASVRKGKMRDVELTPNVVVFSR